MLKVTSQNRHPFIDMSHGPQVKINGEEALTLMSVARISKAYSQLLLKKTMLQFYYLIAGNSN